MSGYGLNLETLGWALDLFTTQKPNYDMLDSLLLFASSSTFESHEFLQLKKPQLTSVKNLNFIHQIRYQNPKSPKSIPLRTL